MDMYTYVRNEKPIYHIDLLSLIGESSIAIVILNLGGQRNLIGQIHEKALYGEHYRCA